MALMSRVIAKCAEHRISYELLNRCRLFILSGENRILEFTEAALFANVPGVAQISALRSQEEMKWPLLGKQRSISFFSQTLSRNNYLESEHGLL